MIQGKQTWIFDSNPKIIGSAAVGGPYESQGALAKDFDLLHEDIWLDQDSFEKAEREFLIQACETAISKAGINREDVSFFLSGDLINQIVPSSFTARMLGIPYMGLYGACASSIEGLSIASLIVNNKFGDNVLIGTSSHNAASEKQYRYPTEYGSQKPPTAQWTVTGAGAAIVSLNGKGPRITSSTIGKVIDMGLSDPFNMGAAMAPAAVDTIEEHFKDMNINHESYDFIATGDLGKIGHTIARDLLNSHNNEIPEDKFADCGLLMYKDRQKVFSGGSGCACVATTTFGHLINRIKSGELKRILVVGTGALMSPMSYQQKESIPCISHAVSIEM